MASVRDILDRIKNDVHGADRHTDITRSLWIASRGTMVARESATATTIGTVPNDNATISLADAATQAAGFNVLMPADAKASSPVLASVYWLPAATVAGDTAVRWTLTFMARTNGDDAAATGTTTTFTGVNGAKTQTVLVVETAQQVLASASANNYIRGYLRRVGGDAADTMTTSAHLLGIRLDYLAVQ